MPLAIVRSRACAGVAAPVVIIEVDLSRGLPCLNIVGLPEKAVKESKDRVRSALLNSGFEFPTARVTVNLAPADLPKEGGRFDLPIAIGILAATAQIPAKSLVDYEFAGELALSGELRPISGGLAFAIAAQKLQKKLILPAGSATEAAISNYPLIYSANHITQVCAHFCGGETLTLEPARQVGQTQVSYPDLADVIGQQRGKRALEIVAAGGHSLLLSGPPGAGKTMLASRLPGILPAMTQQEALEVALISSVSSRGFDTAHWWQRPFRAPHHTASSVALVGGGSPPKPGEISLAHRGVLFLDELPEFQRTVLDALREPLESGCVTISRASRQAQFHAAFQLIAAMNPCPCGYYGSKVKGCRCSSEQVMRYQSKISGPILDRIDMHLDIPPVATKLLMASNAKQAVENSASIRRRVESMRKLQQQRQGCCNAQLAGEALLAHCKLPTASEVFLTQAVEKLGLSARAMHRLLKLARTIADLAQVDNIAQPHVEEALSYRRVEFDMTRIKNSHY